VREELYGTACTFDTVQEGGGTLSTGEAADLVSFAPGCFDAHLAAVAAWKSPAIRLELMHNGSHCAAPPTVR
jgi:hypothetical protein